MGLLSMFGLDSCNAQQKDNTAKKELHYTMNESAPKNYYLLTMSSNGCNFRILVNDIPVYGFWDEGTYSGSYPINHLLLYVRFLRQIYQFIKLGYFVRYFCFKRAFILIVWNTLLNFGDWIC